MSLSREILLVILILISGALYIGIAIFSYWWFRRARHKVEEKDREIKYHLYEVAILKEIADRTGYSLNIKKILDVIAGSLGQFLEYSAVSYMLIEPSKILFKIDLEHSVSAEFINEIKKRMIASLSALTGHDVSYNQIEETITGALTTEDALATVQSYFNIPLVIGTELVGVLTIADTKAGLYKEKEMEILYKIVNQASQAVTKLEEVIKAEQGKIVAMIESMVEGVVMTDLNYRIVAVNQAARTIIGYIKSETPTIFDFIDIFKDAFDIKSKLEESIKLDKIVKVEEVLFNQKYYQVLVTPVKSSGGATKGKVLGGAVIFHDITNEKEVEKMRNDFTSMLVHELRSPLGNIKKIGELLKSPKILDDKKITSEYVSMLYESSSAMLDMVNDLLDVAKLESGKFVIDKQSANIREIILARIKFFEMTAQSLSISLKSSIASDIPALIDLDTNRIAQVLNNLISNALNHTPHGGTVTALCFLHKKGEVIDGEATKQGVPWVINGEENSSTKYIPESVVIAVTDTGEGIPPESLKKLWNKFTQFESSARQKDHQGTGLGLVIVKGIIEAHGGAVGVRSISGKGSTFYFTLPCV
ncbi:MAG: PAS domain-containing protein [Candidatus Yonathbacteria bacterium]|nr:PAS domain-containing protein [Candidatus Yonathbacteria bacterium]